MIEGWKRARRFAVPALAALLIAACGGGSDPDPVRGGIVGVDDAPDYTKAQIDAAAAAAGLGAVAGAARCDVAIQRVRYQTIAPGGAFAEASTAVMVPAGTDPACQGSRPVVLYAHGTTTLKSFDMANVANNAEAALAMATYAAQGFIVVAPNYLGYAGSSLGYHPYLNAEAQAIDVIDGLRAARGYLNSSSAVRPSGRLFVTGYSQGGHVAMAVQKVLERDHAREFTLAGSAPAAGPYNLVGYADANVSPTGTVAVGATVFANLLLTSYQRSYGNMYASPSDVYQAPFDATAETLFPTDTPLEQLIVPPGNKLPADPTYRLLFGTGGLLTDAFRASYLSTTTPSPVRDAAARNTLIGVAGVAGTDWTPAAPMALCGGPDDPTVFWAPNTPPAQAYFNARLPTGAAPVQAWNLDVRSTFPTVTVNTGNPVEDAQFNAQFNAQVDALFNGWTAAKAAYPTQNALLEAYHGLAAPFCSALARGFFQLRLLQLEAAASGSTP